VNIWFQVRPRQRVRLGWCYFPIHAAFIPLLSWLISFREKRPGQEVGARIQASTIARGVKERRLARKRERTLTPSGCCRTYHRSDRGKRAACTNVHCEFDSRDVPSFPFPMALSPRRGRAATPPTFNFQRSIFQVAPAILRCPNRCQKERGAEGPFNRSKRRRQRRKGKN